MAEMCEFCIYRDDEFCLAIGEDCDTITDEDCECFAPIMEDDEDDEYEG